MRNWWKQRRIDDGRDPDASTSELEELRRLRKQNRELRRANEILKAASVFSQWNRATPRRDDRFVDARRDRFGVEAICRTLVTTVPGFITSRGYRAARRRLPSARSVRDKILTEELVRLHAENHCVYGVCKMHHAMRRTSWEAGGDQVARLMKKTGLQGVRR